MKITENTPIALGMVVVLIGGIFWLSRVAFVTESNALSIQTISDKQERYLEDIQEIKSDVKIIKNKLEESRK
jgi:hypothetical protein